MNPKIDFNVSFEDVIETVSFFMRQFDKLTHTEREVVLRTYDELEESIAKLKYKAAKEKTKLLINLNKIRAINWSNLDD